MNGLYYAEAFLFKGRLLPELDHSLDGRWSGAMIPWYPWTMLMITSPHSGEKIPSEAPWLHSLLPAILLTDVDRFVDQLYRPITEKLGIPFHVAEFHRYAVDLNRLPSDIDARSVESASAAGNASYVSGFHWVKTTKGDVILPEPISRETHDKLVKRYHDPFHEEVKRIEESLIARHGFPRFHLDVHSMPSLGTSAHKDAGARRPDLVISDCSGKSCSPHFKDLVMRAFHEQGFSVSYNWPYLGGRMTERYGNPAGGRHSTQVELNRALYLDEGTREKSGQFAETQERLAKAVALIHGKCESKDFRGKCQDVPQS